MDSGLWRNDGDRCEDCENTWVQRGRVRARSQVIAVLCDCRGSRHDFNLGGCLARAARALGNDDETTVTGLHADYAI